MEKSNNYRMIITKCFQGLCGKVLEEKIIDLDKYDESFFFATFRNDNRIIKLRVFDRTTNVCLLDLY